ncbi:MAG: hypothetical protein H0X25_01335 [Acidobacteriales bacterium]|nr:hypothetical protein [Terriglobales bacterium]
MVDLRSYLPPWRNLIAAVAGFLVMGLVYWWWTSIPHNDAKQSFVPADQLDILIDAVHSAHSWRATTFGSMHGEPFQTDQDVVCPYESHTVTHILAPGKEDTVAEEFIETRDMFYAHEGNDPWASQPSTHTNKCAAGPMAGPTPLITTLNNLRATMRLVPGELVNREGGQCRAWSLVNLNAGTPFGSICLDEVTHLPYDLRIGVLHVRYSNWNVPAYVAAPATEAPPADSGPAQP